MIFGRILESNGFEDFNSQVSSRLKAWLLEQVWDMNTSEESSAVRVDKQRFCHMLHTLRLDTEAAAMFHQQVLALKKKIETRKALGENEDQNKQPRKRTWRSAGRNNKLESLAQLQQELDSYLQ
jgi:hypothetical protein